MRSDSLTGLKVAEVAQALSASEWRDRVEGGLVGALLGDAFGVPYEFKSPQDLPPTGSIQMVPPPRFLRSHASVEPGTWSDDGAQLLCMTESLLARGRLDATDLGSRLLRWLDRGHLAVDRYVFDVGHQTAAALEHLRAGAEPLRAGLSGWRHNGNGALIRCLPLGLLLPGGDQALVVAAAAQSRLTHAHPLSRVSCALYALWARCELERQLPAWENATERLRQVLPSGPLLEALDEHLKPEQHRAPNGGGFVVDTLHSARFACEAHDHEAVVRAAVGLGGDTDSVAAVAGGIAGIRHAQQGLPRSWLALLRGHALLTPIVAQIHDLATERQRAE